MTKNVLICSVLLLLTACAVKQSPLAVNERYEQAKTDVYELFTPQKNITKHIDYYEALARALKYNLDYRIKLANLALQAGQLRVAEFTMFPALNATGSLYTRDNQMSSYGVTSQGVPTDVLNSTPNTLRTARVALSWNILDFGLGYVRAQQQSERILIAQEESRKQEQKLVQDVLIAYWEAYNAQQLLNETNQFDQLLEKSKKHLEVALQDKTIPQENILKFQAAILEGNRRLVQLGYKYHKAMLDLYHLLNLPSDQNLILAPPPASLFSLQKIEKIDFNKLDAITLVKRPELRGQEYQKRVAELGVKLALIQALPGITLNYGWNYDSNQYLINNRWMDRSIDLAWNLLNLASLPANYDAAKLGVKYEELKRMALTITVLTETRYAYWHYRSISNEYQLAHKQTLNAEALFTLNKNREIASTASDQQVILAELNAITTKMDEQLLMSDLSTALGELYLSTGSDLLTIDMETQSIPELTKLIKQNFILENTLNFNEFINHQYAILFPTPISQPHSIQNKKMIETKKFIVEINQEKEKIPEPFPQIKPLTASPVAMEKYTIQIFGSYALPDVKDVAIALKEKYMIGKTTNHGKDWYVLTIGRFNTMNEANQMKNSISKKYDSSSWVRNTRSIKWLA